MSLHNITYLTLIPEIAAQTCFIFVSMFHGWTPTKIVKFGVQTLFLME